MIQIKGKVKHISQVQHALGKAPEKFRSGMLGSLLTERDMFVGKKGKLGSFPKKLIRKTSLKGEKWPAQIARIFGGRVDGGKKIDGMKLVMGVGESRRTGYRHKNRNYGIGKYTGARMPEIMDFLNYGGTVVPKGRFMIIPIYRNLPSKKKTRMQWQKMLKGNELEFVREGGRVYYFKKDGYGDDRDLYFIGVKRATIRRQYNFQGDWSKRLPRAYDRIQKRIDRVTERINKAKV